MPLKLSHARTPTPRNADFDICPLCHSNFEAGDIAALGAHQYRDPDLTLHRAVCPRLLRSSRSGADLFFGVQVATKRPSSPGVCWGWSR